MKHLRVSVGQSIVFMAILILILIAFAGLTIDTGNAFARQRTIQAAANASAVAGMNSVVLNYNDASVAAVISQTMTLNGVKKMEFRKNAEGWGQDPDVVYYHAEYLNREGKFLDDVGVKPSSYPFAQQGDANLAVEYVRVTTSVDVSTTFASVVGVPKFPVGANGVAGLGTCLQGVYPITFKKEYLENDPVTGRVAPVALRDPYMDAASIPAASKFTVSRDPKSVGNAGNFLWVRWNGDQNSNGANNLRDAMTGSGTLANGFQEKPGQPNGPNPGQLEKGDWLATDPGLVASIDDQLNFHISNKTIMILPIYDAVNGGGNNPSSAYRVSHFVKVRLLSYTMQGNKSSFTFALVSNNAVCSRIADIPNPTPNKFRVAVNEQLLWYVPSQGVTNYDIAVVQDYSASMGFCWDSAKGCSVGTRRIDYAAPVLREFVDEMLVKRTQQFGAENRLAYVTFGHKEGGKVIAKQRIPFNNDRNATLAAFKNLIGDTASPKTISGTELNGNTPTADGLSQAVALLNNGRKVDSKGKPVKLVVLLITDGLTNVRFDGNQYGVPNTWFAKPGCGTNGKTMTPPQRSDIDMDNPYIQSTCPNKAGIRAPIQATIDVANDARAAKNMIFYAVVLGFQDGNTPEDLRLDQIAPGNYAAANSPDSLAGIVRAISQELGNPCTDGHSLVQPADAATITIRTQETKAIVGTYSPDKDGIIEIELTPGNYTIEGKHLGAIAPPDPLAVPRNYTKLTYNATPQRLDSISFVMPDSNLTHADILLNIDNPDNAKCPQ